MKGNFPLDRAKHHRALLQLLAHPEVTLSYGPMVKYAGRVAWDDIMPPSNIRIRVDANAEPLDHLSKVIHELIHVTLRAMFVGWVTEAYEEIALVAYEADMYAFVRRDRRRREKWLALIAQKLKEAA